MVSERSKVKNTSLCSPTSWWRADDLCQLKLHKDFLPSQDTQEWGCTRNSHWWQHSGKVELQNQSESSQECTCHCRPLDRRHGLGFSFSQHQFLLHQECYHQSVVDFYPSSLFPWFIIKFYTNLQKGSKKWVTAYKIQTHSTLKRQNHQFTQK